MITSIKQGHARRDSGAEVEESTFWPAPGRAGPNVAEVRGRRARLNISLWFLCYKFCW